MKRKSEKVYIYGKHALMEALAHAPHVVKKAYVATDFKAPELHAVLSQRSIPTARIQSKEAKAMVGSDTSHQGVIGVIDTGALMRPLDTFLDELEPKADTALVLLDELQDPHNVGAIIRSAAAFGAAGVLLPQHNQAPVTGAVVKASAGMAFRVPLISIGNVNNSIELLKKRGFWVYGLAMDGEQELRKETFDAPSLFIVGNEGEGIRAKTLEHCDVRLHIPMHPRTESLNASVSAAVVLYQWSMQHAAVAEPTGESSA